MTRDHHHHITVFYTVTAIVVAIAAATILSCVVRICSTPEERAWVLECIRESTVTGEDVGENVNECRIAGHRLFEQTAEACGTQEKP